MTWFVPRRDPVKITEYSVIFSIVALR